MQERYFIYQEKESNKFWEIQFWDNGFRTFWGKVGTAGRFKIQEFDNLPKCEKEVEKLINEKLSKGYIEQTKSVRFLEADVLADIHEFEEHKEIKVHPLAKKLMNEQFLWSNIEETSPFGSDDGSDTFWFYRDWIQENPKGKAIEFLKELLHDWYGDNYKMLNWNELDESIISRTVDESFIHIPMHVDTSIITTAFSQLVLKGKVDRDILHFAFQAIKRQLLPTCLEDYVEDYREVRMNQLRKLASILESLD